MGNSESQQLLNNIQSQTGYYFKNKEVLIQALTHDSLRTNNTNIPTYQRLEFLGDSVLQYIITDYLFNKYPTDNEGSLTNKRANMVSGHKQQEIATMLKLEKYVQLGDSVQRQTGPRFKRYDSFVEALMGAIYIDAGGSTYGLQAVKSFVYRMWGLTEPNQSSCIIS